LEKKDNLRIKGRFMPDIAVISGSKSDQAIVDKIVSTLEEKKASYQHVILSAHRNPKDLEEFIAKTDAKVFIGVAGMSAALPGYIASRTKRPVIGVPVSAKLGGIDALLSIVQMPPGVPVACMGIDAGENAALLALRMLNLR
jgi:5-(carboxyamino)imidazole ribonucleotide mutase